MPEVVRGSDAEDRVQVTASGRRALARYLDHRRRSFAPRGSADKVAPAHGEATTRTPVPCPRAAPANKRAVGIHVAIIMDGNGRGERSRAAAPAGHIAGARVVRKIVESAPDAGSEC